MGTLEFLLGLFLYVKRDDILTAKNKTNSNERELVPKMGKEIRKSPAAQN